jgi:hypothetical protein
MRGQCAWKAFGYSGLSNSERLAKTPNFSSAYIAPKIPRRQLSRESKTNPVFEITFRGSLHTNIFSTKILGQRDSHESETTISMPLDTQEHTPGAKARAWRRERANTEGLVYLGATAKADSSAALRNDKQSALWDDEQKCAVGWQTKRATTLDCETKGDHGLREMRGATTLPRCLPMLDYFVRSGGSSFRGSSLLVVFRVRWRSERR